MSKKLRAAAVLAYVFCAISAQAVSISQAQGKVLFLKSGSYTWAEAASGQVLAAGDQLKTATGSRATVTFDDGSRVDLNAGSSFTLKDATPQASEMQLHLGSLRAWISKSLNRRFQVRTPTAVCSVRGTEFAVDVGQDGGTHVQMFTGLLAVSDKTGNEVLLKDKQSMDVTSAGLGKVGEGQTASRQSGEDASRAAKREVDLRMSKEEVQAAAAEEAKLSEYQQGKSLIDVNGNRVRLEEYIVRPAANQFKLVVLNERSDRFDYFFYHGTFNTALPGDMSLALRQLNGCIDVACGYYLTTYRTGRSNTIDSMLEVASGGHQVDVNNNGYAGDVVSAAYDSATESFISLAPGRPYFQTLFDNYSQTFNGVPHHTWAPVSGSGILNTSPAQVAYTDVTAPVSNCAPPDCTYNEIGEGVFHDVVYAANGAGDVWEKYDSYVISDAGKIARVSDFSATGFSGTAFKTTLLGWNFQTIVTASEFAGRKIDLVVEPKIFIQSGIIQ